MTQLIDERKRGDCCNLLRVFCCGEKRRGKVWGCMVHASLRHAFMVELYPDMEDDLGDGLDEDDDERAVRALIQEASRREPVKLSRQTASLYRKSIQVRLRRWCAFRRTSALTCCGTAVDGTYRCMRSKRTAASWSTRVGACPKATPTTGSSAGQAATCT